ncbi:MAG: hypothetical protein E6J79_18290, partial [Deltaproteobacteria bacterium]
MSWLPARAELAGHPGRALVGGVVAIAAVVFLGHGYPPGMAFESPVDVYPAAKFSPASLLPRRQLTLYLALSTPAGTALVRNLENQAFLQAQLAYDSARSRRSPEWQPVTPEVREHLLDTARAQVERAWSNLWTTSVVIDLLLLITTWWLVWQLARLVSRPMGVNPGAKLGDSSLTPKAREV